MMTRSMLLAAALLVTPSVALAQAEKADPGSLSNKQMEQQPKADGTTAKPTATPEDGSLPDKAMKDQPGTTGGSTDMPTAEPKTGDLPAKAEDDMGKK